MLASPVESAEEALSYFQNASVEDKYDGIRAQAHIGGGEVRLFSRTRDEITESFPELVPTLVSLPFASRGEEAILDGEIVAWKAEGARASLALQRAAAAPRPKEGERQADARCSCRLPGFRRPLRRREAYFLTLRYRSGRRFSTNCWQNLPRLSSTGRYFQLQSGEVLRRGRDPNRILALPLPNYLWRRCFVLRGRRRIRQKISRRFSRRLATAATKA